MQSHYKGWPLQDNNNLVRVATHLMNMRAQTCRIAPMILMTDPNRIDDPVAAAAKFPIGGCIIYRHFGANHKFETAQILRQVTFDRAQQLLIGADPELAMEVGADGVHFRRDPRVKDPNIWRERCPEWIITMAGLKNKTRYTGNLDTLDGLFLSSVFESLSPSAGSPIGVNALRAATRHMPVPIVALGGIRRNNVLQLKDTGICAIAGVNLGTENVPE